MNIHEHADRNFYSVPTVSLSREQQEKQDKKERDEKILAEKIMRETGCTPREFWDPDLSVRDRQIIAGLLVINRIDLATKFLENPKLFRGQHQPLIRKAMSLLNNSVDKESIPEEIWKHVVSGDE